MEFSWVLLYYGGSRESPRRTARTGSTSRHYVLSIPLKAWPGQGLQSQVSPPTQALAPAIAPSKASPLIEFNLDTLLQGTSLTHPSP